MTVGTDVGLVDGDGTSHSPQVSGQLIFASGISHLFWVFFLPTHEQVLSSPA